MSAIMVSARLGTVAWSFAFVQARDVHSVSNNAHSKDMLRIYPCFVKAQVLSVSNNAHSKDIL